MGPVPQPVFKTGEAWQPHAGLVRLQGRSVPTNPCSDDGSGDVCDVIRCPPMIRCNPPEAGTNWRAAGAQSYVGRRIDPRPRVRVDVAVRPHGQREGTDGIPSRTALHRRRRRRQLRDRRPGLVGRRHLPHRRRPQAADRVAGADRALRGVHGAAVVCDLDGRGCLHRWSREVRRPPREGPPPRQGRLECARDSGGRVQGRHTAPLWP